MDISNNYLAFCTISHTQFFIILVFFAQFIVINSDLSTYFLQKIFFNFRHKLSAIKIEQAFLFLFFALNLFYYRIFKHIRYILFQYI